MSTPRIKTRRPAQDIVQRQMVPRSVCVIGLGQIGLPMAAVLACHGYQVHGFDLRRDVVATIRGGGVPFVEPELGELVSEVVRQGTLQLHSTPQPADVFVLCVPTTIRADQSPDLSLVSDAARLVRPVLRKGNLVLLDSSSPPGTTEDVVAALAVPSRWRMGRDVFVAHSPERVRPGHLLAELVQHARVVGGITPACTERAVRFFRSFVHGPIHTTTARTAELSPRPQRGYLGQPGVLH